MSWENPYWLSWQDDGKAVQVEIEGSVLGGHLHVHDTFYGEEGEEFPMFNVVLDTGEELPFSNDFKWRYA